MRNLFIYLCRLIEREGKRGADGLNDAHPDHLDISDQN